MWVNRLVVIGAGPIGLELAQAFARLGSEVTVLTGSSGRVMGKEEEDAASLATRTSRIAACIEVKKSLEADAVQFLAAKVLHIDFESPGGLCNLYDEPFTTYKLLVGHVSGLHPSNILK